MAERQPLVLVTGVHRQIDPADTIPASNLPTATPLAQGAIPPADFELIHNGAKSALPLTTVATPYAGTETVVGVPGMATKTVTEMGGAAALAAYITANSSCDCTLVGTAFVLTAKAYGTALNGSAVSGTLFTAGGTMAGGRGAQSLPVPLDLGLDALTPGAALTNADVSIAPGTDKASEYTLPAATLTGAHTVTLATTGSPTTGLTVWIIRRDLTANTYAIINGGAGAGTLVTLPASPGKPMGACLYYDGTNWSLTAVVYIVA